MASSADHSKVAVSDSSSNPEWITVRIPLVEPNGEMSLKTVEIPYNQYLDLVAANESRKSASKCLPEGQGSSSQRSSGSSIEKSSNVNAIGIVTAIILPPANSNLPRLPEPEKSSGPVTVYRGRQLKDKRYYCTHEGCSKSYRKSSHLQAHLRQHAGQRPYTCHYAGCEKSFTRTDELKRHQLTHSGERNYLCSICDKRFLRKDHLVKHTNIHKNKRYQDRLKM